MIMRLRQYLADRRAFNHQAWLRHHRVILPPPSALCERAPSWKRQTSFLLVRQAG